MIIFTLFSVGIFTFFFQIEKRNKWTYFGNINKRVSIVMKKPLNEVQVRDNVCECLLCSFPCFFRKVGRVWVLFYLADEVLIFGFEQDGDRWILEGGESGLGGRSGLF